MERNLDSVDLFYSVAWGCLSVISLTCLADAQDVIVSYFFLA